MTRKSKIIIFAIAASFFLALLLLSGCDRGPGDVASTDPTSGEQTSTPPTGSSQADSPTDTPTEPAGDGEAEIAEDSVALASETIGTSGG